MTIQSHPNIAFRPVTAADIEKCAAIEAASYPADEAASPEALRYRQAHAGDYFLCATSADSDGIIIGFVCSTRCAAFTHESMSTHQADGPLLAIHSVVVDAAYRRQGIATRMLKAYIQHVISTERQKAKAGTNGIRQCVLLAKAHLLAFYVQCGFTVVRPSPIVHGQELWYELVQDLPSPKQPPCFVVDAFCAPSSQRGTGNPAAVVLLDDAADDTWMQQVAAEFNLSETAFVWQPSNEDASSQNVFCIRYFTPTTQVNLCGHATLAAASVLFQTDRVSPSATISFQAPVDLLHTQTVKNDPTQISMTFPANPAVVVDDASSKTQALDMLEASLGLSADQIEFIGVAEELGDLLVQVSTPDMVRSLGRNNKPIDFDAMKTLDGYSRGIIVTSPGGDDKVDFVSRFFAPKAGIPEDPVTGSAHTVLVPYYHTSLARANGSNEFVAQQWSSRGGWLTCKYLPSEGKVEIAGRAVFTLRGHLE